MVSGSEATLACQVTQGSPMPKVELSFDDKDAEDDYDSNKALFSQSQ